MARRNQSQVPMRRCIGCMESKEKDKLLRIAYCDGKLMVDPQNNLDGRGCYLCKDSDECFKKAVKKKAFQRTFKRAFSEEEILELKDGEQNGK